MWFTEDGLTPGVLFAVAGLVSLLSGLNSGRRGLAAGGLLGLVVAGIAFAVDAAVVTEQERIETSVRSICDDFKHKRDQTLNYFSPTVPALQQMAKLAMDMVDIQDEPRITDMQIQITNEGSRATTHFRANATVSLKTVGNVGYQPSRFIITWAREPEGWKIIKVQRMDPIQDRELGILDQSAR